MKRSLGITSLALVAALGTASIAPMALGQSSTQKQKNDWRNLGIGAAAIAGYGLLNHNSTAAILGAAGAAYSASRYEQERKSQDQKQRQRARYHRADRDYESTAPSKGRKYYHYQGHLYYLQGGQRHLAD